MKNQELYDFVAWIVVVVGGINWGLVGLLKLNLVEAILGVGFLSRLIYIIVGVAAAYLIYRYFEKKKTPIV